MSSIERETKSEPPPITSSATVLIIYGQINTRFQIAKNCARAHTLLTTDSPHQALNLLAKRQQDGQPPPTHLLLDPAEPFGSNKHISPQEAGTAQPLPPSCIGFRDHLLQAGLITPDTACIAIYYRNCPPDLIQQVKQAGFFTQKDPFTQTFEAAQVRDRQPLRYHTSLSTKPEYTSLAALASHLDFLRELAKIKKD